MTQDEYKNFLTEKFSEEYSVGEFYLAKKYGLVAQNVQDESLSAQGSFINHKAYIVSFKCNEKFVQKELDDIPNIALSGFRNSMKDKTTTIVRVFVMDEVPFSLIQEVRSFKFSRSELTPHRSYSEARIIIVDFPNNDFYANLAGEENVQDFKMQN